MYDIEVIVQYNDNKSYRNCLRKVTNMNLDKLNIPWEKMDSDLDEEGNIIQSRMLIPEEFSEYVTSMGETKNNQDKEAEAD